MAGSRFDAWTRRRFGFAAGGLVASLFGGATLDGLAARRKRRQRKHRCRKAARPCKPGGKRRCCDGLLCREITGSGRRCCKNPTEPCTRFDQCCSGFCFEGACLDT
jgi:hypothetical protein